MCLSSDPNPSGCRLQARPAPPQHALGGSSRGEGGAVETVESAVSGYLGEPTSVAEDLCSELGL